MKTSFIRACATQTATMKIRAFLLCVFSSVFSFGFSLGFSWMILTGCSNTDVAGGGIETTNGISGLVRTDDQTVLSGARVQLLYQNQILAEDTTDEQGFFSLNLTHDSLFHCLLQITHPDGFLHIQQLNLPAASADTLWQDLRDVSVNSFQVRARDSQNISLWCGEFNPTPCRAVLHIRGTQLVFSADSEGQMNIGELPSGNYMADLYSPDSANAEFRLRLPVSERQSSSNRYDLNELDSLLLSPVATTVLEDFERPEIQRHKLSLYDNHGWWWISGDEISVELLSESVTACHGICTNDSGWTGRGFYALLTPEDSVQTTNFDGKGFINFGVDFSSGMNYPDLMPGADLSRMDSVCFWAKGSGAFDLRLAMKNETQDQKPQVHFELESAWQQFCLSPERDLPDFDWATYAADTRNLEWFFTDTAEIWLDQIEISGPVHFYSY